MSRTNDEPAFMPLPRPYYEAEQAPTTQNNATNATAATAPDELTFMPARPYYASNEMATLDQLRQKVIELIGEVGRSAKGSAERLKAERELITAEANLRTAARAHESKLEGQISALRRPGADDAQRSALEAELRSVRELLRAIDTGDTTASKGATNDAASVLERAAGIVGNWRGGVA